MVDEVTSWTLTLRGCDGTAKKRRKLVEESSNVIQTTVPVRPHSHQRNSSTKTIHEAIKTKVNSIDTRTVGNERLWWSFFCVTLNSLYGCSKSLNRSPIVCYRHRLIGDSLQYVCEGLRTFHSSRSLTFSHMLNFKRMKILVWKWENSVLDHQITIIVFRAYLEWDSHPSATLQSKARKTAVCQKGAECGALSDETSSSCNNSERKKKEINGCW